MHAHFTYVRSQEHIADLQRRADQARRAATRDAEPAEPRRTSARRPWIELMISAGRGFIRAFGPPTGTA